MDPSILQIFQNELICLDCRNYFLDPITTDNGHSICRPCFYLNWPDSTVIVYGSECQEEIQNLFLRNFGTNVTLKEIVLVVRRAHLRQFLCSRDNRCGIHMEAKQIFCEDQRSLLCLHCSTSQEHEAHRHCSVEEEVEQLRIYVNSKREGIRAEYDNLPPSRYMEELHYIEILQREGKEIFYQLKDSEARMAHKTELLRGMYTELKEMCHKPGVELLLNFGDILHRSEAVCEHMPQPVKAELTAVTISGMIARFELFKEIVILRHARTHGHVFLDGSLISLDVGCGPLDELCITSQYECFLNWGVQTFTIGRHYWEIDVGDTWNWAVGVCCDELNFGDILHRSEAVCEHMPQPVKAELTAVTISGMIARFELFKGYASVSLHFGCFPELMERLCVRLLSYGMQELTVMSS
ncbi:putative tripartite motif-containing protein 49B [Pipistrellus kuhlii]|uniref:putative tripartite motif-containing protein 49B n=1 Tax=Pipistrellus kuhlii TaxID=59472 RepID=UPI001E26EEAB|nr:putative tripartite motif-containing protein 49B [Pipistrellus kuhlii]